MHSLAPAFEQAAFKVYNKTGEHELTYHAESLAGATLHLAAGSPAVCTFVNDHLDASVLQKLSKNGTKIVALRCAGHDSVDLKAAEANGITVVRVPAYSPHAIAEYTVGLLLSLDRKIPAAWTRVQAGNFTLDGLLGQNLHQKTIGIVGTGRIGAAVAQIFQGGLDCRVLANDLYRQPRLEQLGVQYVERGELFRESDVVCLHCPLTHETTHLINAAALQSMKPGALLVNTSRGGLIDTKALIDALESHHLGGCALDVYAVVTSIITAAVESLTVRVALVLNYFFQSAIFPTIFVMALRGQGRRVKLSAAAQIVSIVSGAFVPAIQYAVGNASSTQRSLCVPAACYALSLTLPLYTTFSRAARHLVNPERRPSRLTGDEDIVRCESGAGDPNHGSLAEFDNNSQSAILMGHSCVH